MTAVMRTGISRLRNPASPGPCRAITDGTSATPSYAARGLRFGDTETAIGDHVLNLGNIHVANRSKEPELALCTVRSRR